MTPDVPRLRMFAGPNGSGKSTIKSVLRPELLGFYVNPDELEREMRENRVLSLRQFQLNPTDDEVTRFFRASALLRNAGLLQEAETVRFADGVIEFGGVRVNAYFASVAADFIRQSLLARQVSFTFETAMSSPDKVALLGTAQSIGYRTYLYYVATEDPLINVARVRSRVLLGGHSVPEDKIVSRYGRPLALLHAAVRCSNRAYIFDNSNAQLAWVAEITNGQAVELQTGQMPKWFEKAVWEKLFEE